MNDRFEKITTFSEADFYIKECEILFNLEMRAAVESIIADETCRAVTLSGPSCSGKTTAAARICNYASKFDKKVRLISIDDFYRSHDEMLALGISDFEGISAIDTELFRKVCADLFAMRNTELPTFDFTRGERASMTPYEPSHNDIYIFEGIQAVYPEILACLKDFDIKRIFINVKSTVCDGNVCFDPFEIRLMRRIVRDYNYRASSVLHTLELWDNVRKNEDANILPNAADSEFYLNSSLAYEMHIIGKQFLALTDSFPEDNEHYSKIANIRYKLSLLENDYFDVSMIPEDSLLREFIG